VSGISVYLFRAHRSDGGVHRAQVGGQLSQITSVRKRKLTDFHSCNTNAASTLPSEKTERENLAWSMCVLFMAARQLALVNKTAQVDFEINVVCRHFAEWLRNIIQMHFGSFFGGNLYLSYDRVIAGFMTRQVATTFLSTCARHYCESKTTSDANTKILQDMESAPLTLQSTNVAFCNALTHLVDTNLIMVNQFIRDRISTPIIPLEFLKDLFGTTPIGAGTPLFDELFGWLGQMIQFQHGGGEMEYSSGYITVLKLGSLEDYQQKEAYLESHFGISKNNFYTYITAVRECATKSFDLSGFLCTDGSMLDFQRFVGRLGVGSDSFQNANANVNPPPAIFDTYRNTYLVTQSNQVEPNAQNPAPAAAPPSRGGISKCWVSLIQHLVVTSIQGNCELHADNMFTFGSNLTEFILSRCAPIQSTPAQSVLHESFHHCDNEVVPLRASTGTRPEYFVRSINDVSAINNGVGSELPPVLGPHPLEDVMHLGSWIQLFSILHAGSKPSAFETFPLYNGRPPELVRGRTYPLQGLPDSGKKGTICLCPGRRRGARIHVMGSESSCTMYELDSWYKKLCEEEMMVAPLIFRHHAVFRDQGRSGVWVSSCGNEEASREADNEHDFPVLDEDAVWLVEKQFLDIDGLYTLMRGDESYSLDFVAAHERLVPIGTFILVKSSALGAFGLASNREWIRASIRYPDEGIVGADVFAHRVYFAVKVRERNFSHVRIVCVDPNQCCILDEHPEINSSTVALEAVVQPLAAGQAQE
jgi:hypothetical protein